MDSRGLILAAIALAALVVVGIVMFGGTEDDPRRDEAAGIGAEDAGVGSDALSAKGDEDGAMAAKSPPDRPGPAAGASAPRESSPAMRARREAMLEIVATLSVALANEREIEDTETEEEEKIREQRWSEMVGELKSAVRSVPELADVLYSEIDRTEDDAMAIRLARILRSAEHPEFVERLQSDATGSENARRRRMAVAALEQRDAEVFLEPVSTAFTKDPDPLVRDEAAGVLSRSLMDRRYIRSRVEMRTTLQSALDSDSAADRARAVRALLADPRAGPDELARIRALAGDPDAGVRREVQRAIRVMQPRVERALKKN